MSLELKDLQQAETRIRPYIVKTPLRQWEHLRRSIKHEAPVFLKLETFQNTGSFKVRGAANKILKIIEEKASTNLHMIAASAGNHAQAVAYISGKLGLKSTIVMPEGTPLVKASATADYGAEVVLHGSLYDEAYAYATELLNSNPQSSYVHAYADEDIIAGQGSVGLELHQQLVDAGINADAEIQVVVPIGGGGLVSGVALALKALRPSAKIYGVISDVADGMARSFEAKTIQSAKPAASRTLAEGLAVKSVHPLTFSYIKELCEKIAIVDDDDVAHAIFTLMERGKVVAEGAGAAGVAALLSKRLKLRSDIPTVVVVCGGNIDMNKLSIILEKALVRDERLLSFDLMVHDKPGELSQITQVLSACRANVLDILHDRLSGACPMGYTSINFRIETRGREHARQITLALKDKGYTVRLL